jgi:hypothetical protein
VSLSFICLWQNNLFCRDKDRTLTYRRLIDFVMSFTYFRFLDIRLSLSPSLFPIHLVLRYRVSFGSRFYQTWFLAFQIVIYFIGSCLITWSRSSQHLVSNLGSKNQFISFILFLLVSTSLTLVVLDLVFNNFMSIA